MDLITIIIYLLSNAFRTYIIYQFFRIIFSIELSNKRKVIQAFAFILYFVLISVEFVCTDWSPAVILGSNILGILLLSLIYEGAVKYKILVSIGILVVNLVCEDWVYRLLLALNTKHVVILGTIITNLMSLIILLILQKFFEQKNGENISLSEWSLLISTPIISVIFSVIVMDSCSDERIITVGGICLLILNLLSFYLINYIIKIQKERLADSLFEQQYNAYKTQVKILMDSEKQFSSLRHDMNNHLLVMQQLTQEGKLDSLKSYIDSLIGKIKNEKRYVSTGNIVIDSLLNYKLNIAVEKLSIKPIVNIKITSGIYIEESDISIIIANLLDNAISALEKCSLEKQLIISIKQNNNILIIDVQNTHNEIIKYKNGRFISSKPDGAKHGTGLQNVKQTVEKYSGELDIEYTDERFNVKVLIYM